MISTKKAHRFLGLLLLLPLMTWAITGTIFLTNPGWGDAYQKLSVKQYPISSVSQPLPSGKGWLEVRQLTTILGDHLLVKDANGWQQRTLNGQHIRPRPSDEQLSILLQDAFTEHPERYGNMISIDGNHVITNTGVEITIDWPTLTLQQRGRDTRRIGLLYKVHYLQWSGISWLDKMLGVVGLLLLIAVTLFGARLAFGKRNQAD